MPNLRHLLLIAAAASAPFPAAATEVVILRSGNRIEVERAHEQGDWWHLKLRGGGSITVPASVVRRVSNSAKDLPADRAPVVAQRSMSVATPAAELQAAAIPENIPPGSIRRGPERFETEVSLKMPRLDPNALATAAAPPLPTSRTLGGEQRATALDQATPKRPKLDPRRPNLFRRAGGGPSATGGPRPGGVGGDVGKSSGLPRIGR